MGQCFGKISQNNIIPEQINNSEYDIKQNSFLNSPNITKRRMAKVVAKG
jgi:hypothetical protein